MLLDLTRFLVPGTDWLPPATLRRHGQRYVLAALTRTAYFEARPHLVYRGAVYVAAGLRPYPEFWATGNHLRVGPKGHFTYALDPNTMQYTLLHPPGRERGVTTAVHFHEEGHLVFDLVNNDDRDEPQYPRASARWLVAQWESFYAQHVADGDGHLDEKLVPYIERNPTYRYDAEEAFADLYSCLVRGRCADAEAIKLLGWFQGLAIERHNRARAQYAKKTAKTRRHTRKPKFPPGPQGVPRYEFGQPGDPTPEEAARAEGYGSDDSHSDSSWSEAPIGVSGPGDSGAGAGSGGAGAGGGSGGGAGGGGGGGAGG